ncbi:MAG TPA: potassium channel family protein [Ktedonobacteraceae bacterium]|jgi:hypothetical protein|nr:potassium channel family protein [Ktedonobacteraceae bacterium]
MRTATLIIGVLLILLIAQDGFETIILPRRVSRKFRLTRIFYGLTWLLWSALGRRIHRGNRREQYLSYYGPLSLILLLAVWATIFVLGFAFVQWGLSAPLRVPENQLTFGSYIYFSGTTFFTLGLGDITPEIGISRLLVVAEAGIGFAFLALIIGYVPIIYQAFSRREINIALLDARAGSPPTATELLKRHAQRQACDELISFLHDWERWCSELLESHLSYPVLTYYRSQHERQSWLGALTTLLDSCAIILVGVDAIPAKTAKFTFAIARHVAVDLAQTYGSPPTLKVNRLSSREFLHLQTVLASHGLAFSDSATAEKRLADIRALYEPFLASLADHLLMTLPGWIPEADQVDDWQTSAWDHFLDSSPRTVDHATRSS